MSRTIVKVTDTEYGKMFGVYDLLGISLDNSPITEKKPVSGKFGIRKAKAILSHIEELKKFVEENSDK